MQLVIFPAMIRFTIGPVVFREVAAADLELVRRLRNRESVRTAMIASAIITPEQQEDWFRSIGDGNNLYLIVSSHGKDHGVVNVKQIDWERREGEVGAFFALEDAVMPEYLPAMAVVVFMEFLFGILGFSTLTGKVLQRNTRSLRLNDSTGGRRVRKAAGVVHYTTETEAFHDSTIGLRSAMGTAFSLDAFTIEISNDPPGSQHQALSERVLNLLKTRGYEGIERDDKTIFHVPYRP